MTPGKKSLDKIGKMQFSWRTTLILRTPNIIRCSEIPLITMKQTESFIGLIGSYRLKSSKIIRLLKPRSQ